MFKTFILRIHNFIHGMEIILCFNILNRDFINNTHQNTLIEMNTIYNIYITYIIELRRFFNWITFF